MKLVRYLFMAQQQLNSDINSADLEKLYEEDPTEAAKGLNIGYEKARKNKCCCS